MIFVVVHGSPTKGLALFIRWVGLWTFTPAFPSREQAYNSLLPELRIWGASQCCIPLLCYLTLAKYAILKALGFCFSLDNGASAVQPFGCCLRTSRLRSEPLCISTQTPLRKNFKISCSQQELPVAGCAFEDIPNCLCTNVTLQAQISGCILTACNQTEQFSKWRHTQYLLSL